MSVDSGYVIDYGADYGVSGCTTCGSGASVVSGEIDGTVIYDGGVVYEGESSMMPLEVESGTRDARPADRAPDWDRAPEASPMPMDEPSTAPPSMPADTGDLGDDSMFDESPPEPPADDMFDSGTDDSGDDLDDLFPTSAQMRIWTDNTGYFKTRAQLVELREDAVRLLKENGRHCTVPFDRLSKADFRLVQQIAAARGQSLPLKLAQR
jgi:hypothetical protein